MAEPALKNPVPEKNEIKARLLTTGLDLFSAEGVDGVSVARICREARLANGTFYNFFRGKDDLVGELLDSANQTLADMLSQAGREDLPASEAHRRDVTIIVDFVEQHQRLFEFSLLQRASRRDARNPVYMFAAQRRAEMQRQIDEGRFRGSLHAEIGAFAEVGLITEVLAWWLSNNMPVPRETLIDQLTEIRTGMTGPLA